MTLSVYSGSFDPPTLGHLDVIKRALKAFDSIIIAIGINPIKKGMFTGDDRAKLINTSITEDPELNAQASRISIQQTRGLLAEFAKDVEADALIRGVRSASEFEAETTMALLNRQLCGVETVLLVADPSLGHISSSAVKEIAGFGGSVKGMVPDCVAQALKEKLGTE